MFEIVRILYRELHYQIVKRNPLVANDEKRFKKQLKNALSIKRNLALQSLAFIFFGIFMASGIVLSDNKIVISSLAVSLALVPFIFSLYVTAVQSSYVVSLGLFEPLKSLPIRVGALYLSELLLIDISVSLSIVLPSAIVLLIKFPVNGLLFLLWILVGILAGHSIGLLIFSLFGLRIAHRKTRGQMLKNLFKILGLFAFMSMFYALSYLQEYISKNSEKFASFFGKYIVAYPFSVASIFEPSKSLIFLTGYFIGISILYYFSINKVWKEILEPKITSEKGKAEGFKSSFGGTIFALTLKDLRVIFRKTSMLTGFLVPIYFVFPQLFIALRSGNLSKEQVFGLLFLIGLFSTSGADAILKVEGKEMDFLRTLPISKGQFILSKAFSMSLIPMILASLILGLGTYFDSATLYLIPYVVFLPLNVSLLTMLLLFRYKGKEIGIPEINFGEVLALFLVNSVLLAFIGIPAFIINAPKGLAISYAIALLSLFLMLKKIKS